MLFKFYFYKIQSIYLIFKKFGSVTHNFTQDFVKFQKKLMAQFKENALTGEETDSRNDFYNTYAIALYM